MTDTLTDIWADRRVKIGYETAEELAKCYNRENWRSHPENQRAATEESLDTLGLIGQVKKSTINNLMFDGHLRVELALAKNPQMLLPVDYYDLSDDETALALAVHDAITEQAEPIPDKLAALLERTRAMTADRPGLGAMLERLKERAGINGNGSAPPEPEPLTDRAEELQAKWQVKPGQIWQIDRHFVICGDCREPETWQRLMDAAKVDKVNGVFTSPPYAEQRKKQYGGVPTAEYVEWWGAVQTNVRAALAEDGSFFVNIKPHCEDGQRVLYVFDLVLAMVREWGWSYRDEFIWKHDGFPGEYKYRHRNQFEPIYHFSLEHHVKHFPLAVGHISSMIRDNSGGKRMAPTNADNDKDAGKSLPFKSGIAQVGNVIESAPNSEATGHAAAFPVALPTFFLKAYSDPGDIWIDPFAGSGTTGLAAHNEGRKGLMIEQLPKYVSVILQRFADTGQTPRRVSG